MRIIGRSPPTELNITSNATLVSAGDFNKDGRLDLAIDKGDARAGVLLNQGCWH